MCVVLRSWKRPTREAVQRLRRIAFNAEILALVGEPCARTLESSPFTVPFEGGRLNGRFLPWLAAGSRNRWWTLQPQDVASSKRA